MTKQYDMWRQAAQAEIERVAALINRSRIDREIDLARAMRQADYGKRPGETDLQWRIRVSILDQNFGRPLGDIMPPESVRQGCVIRDTVSHEENGRTSRAVTMCRVVASARATMRDRGRISEEQYQAAGEIALISEVYRRAVSPGCASMEARVDMSPGPHDGQLIERLYAVRLSVAYTRWYAMLPMPKALVLDMIHVDQRLAAIARRYRKSWPWARGQFERALDRWPDIKARVWRQVDEGDVLAVYSRLGDGQLLD